MEHDHWIEIGNAKLAAKTAGEGDPVIFLHANVCDSRMWSDQFFAISDTNLAIVYDRRGFGRTQAQPEEFSAVADLLKVIEALTIDQPVILVGSSQGGRIALDFTLRHPQFVHALILIAPSVSGEPEAIYPPQIKDLFSQLRNAETAGNSNLINRIKAHIWLDGPLEEEGRVKGLTRNLFLEMSTIALQSSMIGTNVDNDLAFSYLGNIEVPALVIWGELDFPHIRERCQRVTKMLKNGNGIILSDTAHLPSLDKPIEITNIITDFINRYK